MKRHNSPEVLLRTYKASANISFVILSVVALIEFIMLLVSVFNAPFYGEYVYKYRIFYTSLLAVAVAYLLLILYIKKDFDARYKVLNLVNPLCSTYFLVWSIGIIYSDSMVTHMVDPTVYMTFSLAVPLCFYMPPLVYFIIALSADLIMGYVTIIMSHSTSTLPNLCIFLAFHILLGISLLDLKRNLIAQIIQAEEQKSEIEELSEAQNRFFSSMSHEVRTPINSIIGLDEMILRENASPVVNEDARHILYSGKLLLHLINGLLDLSKISAGKFELTDAPYRTVDMFSEVWGMLNIQAANKKLEFSIELSPELPTTLSGDALRVEQILVNVVNNAIKYTKEGSVKLTVSCTLEGENEALLTYTVSDTGIGIKEEYMPFLFAAYKRSENEETKHIEGTGLGLSIVKQFLDLMGGSVAVESEFGKGSTFVVSIPQRIIDPEPIGEVDVCEEKKEHEVYRSRLYAPDVRILVVDDTPENLFVVKRFLGSTHVKIDSAHTGLEALKLTAENKYHIILLDHFMPEMDGIETLHAIREQEDGKNLDTRVVMLTANVSKGSEELYVREGFDAHLTKPIAAKDLEDVIIRLLSIDPETKALMQEAPAYGPGIDTDEVPEALIRIFVSSIDETIEQLNSYLENGDIEKYTVKAHSLKSTSRLVKETYLSEQAAKLEEAGKQGDIEAIRRAHPFFIKEYEASKKRLDVFSHEVPKCTDSELRDAYLAIDEFAKSKDLTGVLAILRAIEQYDLSEYDAKILGDIRKAVDDMDFFATCDIIEKIL